MPGEGLRIDFVSSEEVFEGDFDKRNSLIQVEF